MRDMTKGSLVLLPASAVEDLVFVAEAAAMAMETNSPRCEELIDALRGSTARVRAEGILEPEPA